MMHAWALAYGEFRSDAIWSMFAETMPFFLKALAPALMFYGVATIVAERLRCRAIGLLAFTAAFFPMATTFVVLGAYGPAHIGGPHGWAAWPLLWLVLLGKTVRLYVIDWRVRHVA